MEKAIELKENNYKDFNFIGIDRVYMYDSFCQNLIPKLSELENSYKFIKNKNLQFTLNTPFVTDFGIKEILNNIEYLSKYEENFEIVFNSWGLFWEIKKRFPKIKLLLGRLLTKQKTDPTIYNALMDKENIKMSEKNFNDMYKHFQSSIINDGIFQNYLTENDINRVEIEYLLFDMKIELENNIKASIYYPYVHISTTRKCGMLNMYNFECNKTCKKTKEQYNLTKNFPYIVIGNTIYYNIENIMTEERLKKYPSIDRIVFNDIDTYNRYINGSRNKQ